MFFTGFADEASPDFATQIKVTQELGWSNIEARNIGGKMLGTMSDEEFEKVEQLLAESGVKINCYGSAIANWSRHPRKEEDFEASKQELLTALPRMKKLGIKLVRGMSFLVPKDEPGDSPELEAIIFRKVRELVQICADNGVVYGHENCMNYGGMSHLHTLKLVEQMNGSPASRSFSTPAIPSSTRAASGRSPGQSSPPGSSTSGCGRISPTCTSRTGCPCRTRRETAVMHPCTPSLATAAATCAPS